MAVTGGGNIYIFEDDRGFNYRGLWNSSTTYNAGDVVYYGSPQTAYLANATVTTTTPTTQNSGWSRLARRGTDGAAGTAGDYTILLFARSINEPRPPDSTDASYPADVGNFSPTIWSRFEIPSGTDPVWMSWIRVIISTTSLEFGQVFRLSGESGTGAKGDPGDSISAQYSPDGTTDWSATLRTTDKYVRFRIGTGSWSVANKFAGDDGASAQIQFSPDGSTDWVNTGRSTDEYIRFRVGTMPWSIAYKIHGEDGQSISLEFSSDNNAWHSGNPRSNDKYIRFRQGTNAPTTGIKFVGDDGSDGDDSLETRYSVGPSTTLHTTFQPGDKYIHFRIGNTGAFDPGIKFIGDDAPNVRIEFASQPIASRYGAYVAGDRYIRFSNDNGVTWLPTANGIQFVGSSGASVKGDPGDSVSVEFSQDGQAAWHRQLQATDYFIRFQVGTGGWSVATQFRAYPLIIQYSDDGTGGWSTTFTDGSSKYIRFSNDNGTTWTAGRKFIGDDGTHGDDTLELQYSNDNSSWHATLALTDLYIRFRTGNTGPWSTGIRFIGATGGFQATLYQRSANEPTAPTNVTYNQTTLGNPYGGNIGNWVPTIPTGTDQIWRVNVTVPPALTSGNLSVTVNGSVYSERGATGDDGEDGRWYRPVFQWSTSEPTDPSGLSYNILNGTIDGLGQWREAPAQIQTIPLWVAIIRISGSTATYVLKFQYPTITGPAGSQGDSLAVIYTRSATTPADPTGGTYNDSRDFDPPNGWHESIPTGDDPAYMCIVTLSGTNRTNTGISYGSVARITGEDGADPPGLPTNAEHVEFMFVPDQTNQTVTSTRPRANIQTPWVAGYRDIKTFTGGRPGWATQDANGITLARAGFVSITAQKDLQIVQETVHSQVQLILHVEDSNGNKIHDWNITGEDLEDRINSPGITITGNAVTAARHFAAGTRIYTRICYRVVPTSGNDMSRDLSHRVVTPPEDDDRIVISFYTNNAGSGEGTGSTGPRGNSVDIVYRRSATVLTVPPSGGVAQDGEIRTAPSDWSVSVPSGSDPLYYSNAHIDGATNSIRYSEPIATQGLTGENGESVSLFFTRTSTSTPPTQPGILYNGAAFSNFGDWNKDNTGGSGAYLWAVSVAYRIGQNGQRVTGVVPFNGTDGTDGTDADPVQFQYSDNNNGPWSAVYGSSNAYFRSSVDGGTVWSAAIRFRGEDGSTPSDGTDGDNGLSYQQFYHANTANTVGTPNIDYNGTNFTTVTAGWAQTIPTTPAGANIFMAPVRYTEGTAGETIEGVLLYGTVPGTVTPPVQPSRNSYTMNYGLITRSAPYTLSNTVATNALELASGESGYFDFESHRTTATYRNIYFDLPTGLTLVNIQQEQGNQYLDNTRGWTTPDSANPRRYVYSGNRQGAHTDVRVNVRRA